MNSFKAISRAIQFERKRQIEVLEAGKEVVQETRKWDDNKGKSLTMRSKENAQDYRYFPEPDIPPVEITQEMIDEIKNSLPELAEAKIARYTADFDLPLYDAQMITSQKALSVFFEETTRLCGKAKEVSNWIMGDVMRLLKDNSMEAKDMLVKPEALAKLIELVEKGTLNRKKAREIFEVAFTEEIDIDKYIKENNFEQVSDEGIVIEAVEKVFAANGQSISDYLDGKTKAFGYLVGQTMRELKGKADPSVVNRIIQEKLDNM